MYLFLFFTSSYLVTTFVTQALYVYRERERLCSRLKLWSPRLQRNNLTILWVKLLVAPLRIFIFMWLLINNIIFLFKHHCVAPACRTDAYSSSFGAALCMRDVEGIIRCRRQIKLLWSLHVSLLYLLGFEVVSCSFSAYNMQSSMTWGNGSFF